jgi:hypothetical protein
MRSEGDMNIRLLRKGEYFILQNGGEVIKVCGCCGKQLDAMAAAVLLSKIHAGELEWSSTYNLGIAAEFREKDDGDIPS